MTALAFAAPITLFLCWWVWYLCRWDRDDKPASMVRGSWESRGVKE